MSKKPKTSTNEADAIEHFLELNNYSEGTEKLYRTSVKCLCRFLNVDPNDYIKQDRDFETDVRKFAKYLSNKPPTTQKTYLNGVKQFLEEYNIDFHNKVWKKIKNQRKGSKPLTIDKIPDNEDLKRILSDGNIKCKAYFLLLSSSGLREGEGCGITWDDIELDTRKVHIRAEIAKNNHYRYSYFSPEAKEQLLMWKEMYDNYTPKVGEKHKQKCLQNKQDNIVFPFSKQIAIWMWNNLTEKSGYDERDKVTGRHVYHIHSLRKYFETKLINAGMVEPAVQKLLGHEGYLNGSYYRIPEEELKEMYDEHSTALSVFSDIHKLPDMIKPELKKYETNILELQKENIILKKQVSKLQTSEHFAVEQASDIEKGSDKVIGELQAQIKELTKQFLILEKQYRK
jgi:integrase